MIAKSKLEFFVQYVTESLFTLGWLPEIMVLYKGVQIEALKNLNSNSRKSLVSKLPQVTAMFYNSPLPPLNT